MFWPLGLKIERKKSKPNKCTPRQSNMLPASRRKVVFDPNEYLLPRQDLEAMRHDGSWVDVDVYEHLEDDDPGHYVIG